MAPLSYSAQKDREECERRVGMRGCHFQLAVNSTKEAQLSRTQTLSGCGIISGNEEARDKGSDTTGMANADVLAVSQGRLR